MGKKTTEEPRVSGTIPGGREEDIGQKAEGAAFENTDLAAKPKRYISECTEYLRYDYTTEERRQLADEMARGIAEIKRIEDEKATVNASIKSRMTTAQEKVNLNQTRYMAGYDMREVKCQEVKDMDTGMVTLIRLDTGEEVRSRKLNEDERQFLLDLDRDEAAEEVEGDIGEPDDNGDTQEGGVDEAGFDDGGEGYPA